VAVAVAVAVGVDVTVAVGVTATATATATSTPRQITLTANGYKMRGFDTVDVFWSGATSANIDIKRDGVPHRHSTQ